MLVTRVAGDASVGDVPEFDGAVLGAGGDDVVVERVPLDVEHGPRVTGDFTDRQVQPARLFQRQDDEGAAAGHLPTPSVIDPFVIGCSFFVARRLGGFQGPSPR